MYIKYWRVSVASGNVGKCIELMNIVEMGGNTSESRRDIITAKLNCLA